MLVIDIETIAQDDLVPPAFDPPGNIKDPVKIEASLKEKQQKWLNDAALHADRGQVVIVGLKPFATTSPTVFDCKETLMIEETWEQIKTQSPVVGFNLLHFDIPFLVRRSWILGVPVPADVVFDRYGKINRERFIDLFELWACGDRTEFISLNTVATAILGRGKTGHGSDFGKLWATDKAAAIQYCKDDVQLTWDLAKKMLPEVK